MLEGFFYLRQLHKIRRKIMVLDRKYAWKPFRICPKLYLSDISEQKAYRMERQYLVSDYQDFYKKYQQWLLEKDRENK